MLFPIVTGLGIGYILTSIFLFSLGLLYYIDFRYKYAKSITYYSYLIFGVLLLLIFLLFLLKIAKTIISISFFGLSKEVAYKYLVFGIIWGVITFPFLARKLQSIYIKE